MSEELTWLEAEHLLFANREVECRVPGGMWVRMRMRDNVLEVRAWHNLKWVVDGDDGDGTTYAELRASQWRTVGP